MFWPWGSMSIDSWIYEHCTFLLNLSHLPLWITYKYITIVVSHIEDRIFNNLKPFCVTQYGWYSLIWEMTNMWTICLLNSLGMLLPLMSDSGIIFSFQLSLATTLLVIFMPSFPRETLTFPDSGQWICNQLQSKIHYLQHHHCSKSSGIIILYFWPLQELVSPTLIVVQLHSHPHLLPAISILIGLSSNSFSIFSLVWFGIVEGIWSARYLFSGQSQLLYWYWWFSPF